MISNYKLIALLFFLSPNLYADSQKERGDDRAITLTFDDGYSSHYTTVLPILHKYGISATFYITTSVLGLPGYLTQEQVVELKQAGHEIASHGKTHQNFVKLSSAELEEELRESKQTLENIIESPILHFASPFGAWNPSMMHFIKKHYASNRTIVPGLNLPYVNPFAIRAKVVFQATSSKEIENWMDNIEEKKWLVLVYHSIDDSENFVSVSPKSFEEHLKVILNSGLSIVSISERFQNKSF